MDWFTDGYVHPYSYHHLLEYVQFTLIHGPNIPGSYVLLFFSALDFSSIPSHITTGHCFHFGSISSFFLEFFLHSFPVAYWAPTNLGSSSFSVLSFCLFVLFMGFSRQEYWSGLPFPSPVDHVLSEISTMTHLSWVALHGMAPTFIELDKAVVHMISLICFLWLWFSFCLPSEDKDKRVIASWWERMNEGETGSCSDGQGHAQ